LEEYAELYYAFEISEVETQRRNEPDMVCKCLGSDTETDTPNYPKIGHSSSMYFESIPGLPFPTTRNASEFLISFSFVILSDSITDYDKEFPHEILGHKNFWSFGIHNRSQLYLDIVGVTQQ